MFAVLCTIPLLVGLAAAQMGALQKPFLITLSNTTHVIGNSIWNVTIVGGFGRKLYYKDSELVGRSTGHYASLSRYEFAWRKLADCAI
jgi:rhamnogalacturonan endolyase